ncbi:MAG: glucokinase [Planctomycetota bacterium]|jgi:glucokinase
MASDSNQSILSVDIGGTKTAVALVTLSGEILANEQFPTVVEKGPEDLCDRLQVSSATLQNTCPTFELIGVGVSAPGPLSSLSGCFLNPPNMPGWHGFPITEALSQRIMGIPIELMNDANAAAYAEFKFGAGAGIQTMVFFTMSTGMGAGLIIGGRLHEGLDDMAGEVGHTLVAQDGPVGFGRRGSLEGFCSGPGIAQLATTKLTQAIHEERDSALLHLDKDWRLVDSMDVGRAAELGDEVAQDCLRESAARLGGFCADLVDLLNPERIVLGTIGRMHADLMIPVARAEINRIAHAKAAERVQIVPAKLADSLPCLAGAAAFLARQE